MIRRSLPALGALSCAVWCALPVPAASADILTYRFEGSVLGSNLETGPFAGAMDGDPVILEYDVDTSALGLEDPAYPSATAYPIIDGSISMQVDDVLVLVGAIADPLGRRLAVFDDLLIAGPTPFDMDGYRTVIDSPDLDGVASLVLDDEDGVAFSSEAIPTSLDLGDFELAVGFIDGGLGRGLKWQVESISVVPAPGALVLGLGLLGRRRRRSPS
jgi:hypothetical protein